LSFVAIMNRIVLLNLEENKSIAFTKYSAEATLYPRWDLCTMSPRRTCTPTITVSDRQPENDFVVLSNCDHVITSVGTFGWWAAWIANGVTTYYKWPVQPNTYVGNQYNKDFTDFFYPNWPGRQLQPYVDSTYQNNNKSLYQPHLKDSNCIIF
jgi:hypothetical protein